VDSKMINLEKTFDFLMYCIGKKIIVEMINKEIYKGKLIKFDNYQNLVLETDKYTSFLRGANINKISYKE